MWKKQYIVSNNYNIIVIKNGGLILIKTNFDYNFFLFKYNNFCFPIRMI